MSNPSPNESPSKAVDRPRCGAQLRNRPGVYCQQPCGKNTPHEGQGRCWLHGGLVPVKSGRWSKIIRKEIQELLTQLEGEEDPLNILPDLNMVRALLADFLNRYEENRDAMLAWYASWNGRPWRTSDLTLLTDVLKEYEIKLKEGDEWEESAMADLCARAQAMVHNMEVAYTGRPREVLDIADAHRMAVEATKIVERIEKIRARNAVSREDFARVMTELGRTAEAALSPARVRAALAKAEIDVTNMTEGQLIDVADNLRNTLSDMWMTIRVM